MSNRPTRNRVRLTWRDRLAVVAVSLAIVAFPALICVAFYLDTRAP